MKKSVLFLLLALTIPPCMVMLLLTEKLKGATEQKVEKILPPQVEPQSRQPGY